MTVFSFQNTSSPNFIISLVFQALLTTENPWKVEYCELSVGSYVQFLKH